MTPSLAQRHVLITAGPTWEPLDPVRFLSNRSSGKLGYALAAAAHQLGARVTLVSGPTALPPPKGVHFISVVTAREMHRATLAAVPSADIIICAAAVADWRPVRVARYKLKKDGGRLLALLARTKDEKSSFAPRPTSYVLRLIPNPDILATLGRRRKRGQYLVGFALESDRLLKNARAKLRTKRCDCIIANPVAAIGAAWHQATLLFRGGATIQLPPLTKSVLARRLLNAIRKDQTKM